MDRTCAEEDDAAASPRRSIEGKEDGPCFPADMCAAARPRSRPSITPPGSGLPELDELQVVLLLLCVPCVLLAGCRVWGVGWSSNQKVAQNLAHEGLQL